MTLTLNRLHYQLPFVAYYFIRDHNESLQYITSSISHSEYEISWIINAYNHPDVYLAGF